MKKYVLGADIGGTTVKLVLFTVDGELLDKWEIPTVLGEGSDILRDVASSCEKMMQKKNLSKDEFAGIGLGVPGPVRGDGSVDVCVNLGWGTKAVKAEMEEIFGLPAAVGNDANVAALGEMWRGGARGYENVVMVTLGTGVGGGIIIDHKVYSGFNHAGAELGHMVIEHGGVLCSCGRRGCWEAYSSATALIRMTKEKLAAVGRSSLMYEMTEGDPSKVSGKTAFAAAREGDAAGQAVVDLYISYLATV